MFALTVNDRILTDQLHLYAIQILRAVAIGPPQLGVLNFDLPVAVFQQIALSIYYGILTAPGIIVLCLHIQCKRYITIFVLLSDLHILQAIHIIAPKPYRPENAHIRQLGAPVPAGHIECLPKLCGALKGIRIGVHVPLRLHFAEIRIGRREIQPDRIDTRLQPILHIVHKGSVHIFYAIQLFAVEKNIADGIQSLKDQLHKAMLLSNLKSGKKAAGILAKCRGLVLIQTVKGIFHQLIIQ